MRAKSYHALIKFRAFLRVTEKKHHLSQSLFNENALKTARSYSETQTVSLRK